MVLETVLLILALLFIIEGTIISLFPKKTVSLTKKFLKTGNMKVIGSVELIIGIALLIFVIVY